MGSLFDMVGLDTPVTGGKERRLLETVEIPALYG
jgi:hypothetical protein